MYKTNSSQFKKILALVRDGDFAHAGEREAIDLVFDGFERNSNSNVLDVGCGLGGTAAIIKNNGLGHVTGIDILSGTILHAKKHYPEVDFLSCDVLDASQKLDKKFNLIYLFNSFYSFADQSKSLRELRKVADENAELIIFDYTDLDNYKEFCQSDYDVLPSPIKLHDIAFTMKKAGWDLYKQQDLTVEYERWYEAFVAKITQKREQIINNSDEATYDYVYKIYANLLMAIKYGCLGGVVLYARAG
ncbi:MAG: methyltransferase domain-containing protein [Gammaproteobacteria bacterium]|nr:methyltransferase domain-containing protein [Gammaproteobacteria bacterium]